MMTVQASVVLMMAVMMCNASGFGSFRQGILPVTSVSMVRSYQKDATPKGDRQSMEHAADCSFLQQEAEVLSEFLGHSLNKPFAPRTLRPVSVSCERRKP